MNTTPNTLLRMTQALQAFERGELPLSALSLQWRSDVASLPLPGRFGEVAAQLLDRLEAGALFSEESCSFSRKDLLANLHLWTDKAREHLNS